MSISEASASGQAAIFKMEGELLALRKQQQQQKKNFEESLKRKDEKVRKMEKQQADKAKKQAEAFSTATELTKENEALQTKMQNFRAGGRAGKCGQGFWAGQRPVGIACDAEG